MTRLKYKKELYSKVALIKSAYNFTDTAYVHLDADNEYYIVQLEPKNGQELNEIEKSFENEMLAQSVRHEVYLQTKNIRDLLLARAMSTSVVLNNPDEYLDNENDEYTANEILKDWFEDNA